MQYTMQRIDSAAGKYNKENLPGGARALVINEERVDAVQPLLSLMRDIGSAHGGKTPGQVRPVLLNLHPDILPSGISAVVRCSRCAA